MWVGFPLGNADGGHGGNLNREPQATLPIMTFPEQASSEHSQEGVESARITEIMTGML